MDSLGPTRFPEYQAVIIVDNDDGRLFPLTEGCPKCLLPVANRRLLAYQLDLLSKSGALGTSQMDSFTRSIICISIIIILYSQNGRIVQFSYNFSNVLFYQ